MARVWLVCMICLVGLAAGCGDDEESEAASVEGSWTLTDGVDVDGWEKTPPTAEFKDGKLAGSSGCNRYNTSYTTPVTRWSWVRSRRRGWPARRRPATSSWRS